MFCTQEFSSLVCIILQFFILYYLIKMYRALDPSENHQQPLITEARRNRGNHREERINDRADPRIRHTMQRNTMKREDWVSVVSFWNCSKLVTIFFLWRFCTVYEINSALLICSGHTKRMFRRNLLRKVLVTETDQVWLQVSSAFYIMNLKFYFLGQGKEIGRFFHLEL